MANDLQSGDLSGAQKTYSTLQKLLAQGPLNSQNTNSADATDNPLASDFQAIGQALQSGDLSSAQSAFAKFQQDAQSLMQSQGQTGSREVFGHHHHHASSSQDSGAANSGGTDDASDGNVNVLG